jgi:hypothetical protein
VQDYLELCHNPMKDLGRWLKEQDRRKGRASHQASRDALRLTRGLRRLIAKGGFHADAQRAAIAVAKAGGVRGQSLPELQGRMGADGDRGGADRLFTGRRTRAFGDDRLQQIHAAERRGLGTGGESGSSFEAEAAAINSEFSDKLASLRRRLPRWAIPGAVRAIQDERAAAMQGLRARRESERHAEREAARLACAGAVCKPLLS